MQTVSRKFLGFSCKLFRLLSTYQYRIDRHIFLYFQRVLQCGSLGQIMCSNVPGARLEGKQVTGLRKRNAIQNFQDPQIVHLRSFLPVARRGSSRLTFATSSFLLLIVTWNCRKLSTRVSWEGHQRSRHVMKKCNGLVGFESLLVLFWLWVRVLVGLVVLKLYHY